MLSCILRVLDDLDQKDVDSDVLPMLLQAQLSHPSIRISAASKHLSLLSHSLCTSDRCVLLRGNDFTGRLDVGIIVYERAYVKTTAN